MKDKFEKLKARYAARFKENPETTLAGTITVVAAVAGLIGKVNDMRVSSSKAKTWKREVERRERNDRSCRH